MALIRNSTMIFKAPSWARKYCKDLISIFGSQTRLSASVFPAGLSWLCLLVVGLPWFLGQVLVLVTLWLGRLAGTWSEVKHLKREAHAFLLLFFSFCFFFLIWSSWEMLDRISATSWGLSIRPPLHSHPGEWLSQAPTSAPHPAPPGTLYMWSAL